MESSTLSTQVAVQINQAVALRQQGKLWEALQIFQQALSLDPNNFDALLGIGTLNAQLGRFKEALPLIMRAGVVQPNNFAIYCSLGEALQGLKRYAEALARYDEALAVDPENANVYNNRGIVLKELTRYEDALGSCDRAIALGPDFAEGYCNRGNALGNLRRYEDAVASYDRAIALNIDYAEAYYKRGLALQQLKRYGDALTSYDWAISLKPDFAEAYCNRGSALGNLRRYEDAVASYDRAIALKLNYAEAYNNRGIALKDLKRYEDALASFDRATSLRPYDVFAYNNRGIALQDLKRYEDALASYDRAISLKPDFAEAYYNRGNVFLIMRRYEDALDNFNKAISLNSNSPHAYGNRLAAQMHIGLWKNFERNIKELIERVDHEIPPSTPFPLLAIPITPNILQKCASRYIADKYLLAYQALWQGERYHHDRIRIGYFSADFQNHAMAYQMAELFEKHDRSRYEIFAFSFSTEPEDDMRARLVKGFDQFIDVSKQSDHAIAELVRKMEIDIAVDLMGFTNNSRPGIFALRPAPIQASYLGYPGTMGAPFIDYIIADPVVVPKEHFEYYTEKVVHLPYSYQVNDSQRRIADTVPTRSALGLPETGYVFCCFNNNYKITPDLFTIWMRLLANVNGSVLWLFEGNATIQRNLRREAQQRNIDPARLVFAPRMSLEEHLARQRQADVFLDTFYYNAHGTASGALWAGLPVLTCLGNTFAGRVGASLLYAIGLPELVTHSHEEYETLALNLATNTDALAAIKDKLARNRLSYPLFNIDLFTQHIEAAYAAMWRHYQQGSAPDHIYIAP